MIQADFEGTLFIEDNMSTQGRLALLYHLTLSRRQVTDHVL